MLVVLQMTNQHALNRYTGLVAGALVATYITFEAPVSGMSMNPAHSDSVVRGLDQMIGSGGRLVGLFVRP